MKVNNNKLILILFLAIALGCKKKQEKIEIDYKQKIIGTWSGNWQITNPQTSPNYPCSIIFYDNNTGILTDSAFGNPAPKFNNTYEVNSDSLIISFNNGTKWKLKLFNDYASATGIFNGAGGSGIAIINKK